MLLLLFSLLCVKYIFFWFYGSFRFDGNDKYAEKVLRQPWNVLTLQLSLSLRDRQDLVYFASLFRQERVP